MVYVRNFDRIGAQFSMIPQKSHHLHMPASRFAPGETYSFPLDLPGETGIMLVNLIECVRGRFTCHVTLSGINLTMSLGNADHLNHYPVTEDGLAKSNLTFLCMAPVNPMYRPDYESWAARKGGFFDDSLQDTLAGLRKM
jgi:hypothetical protein